MIDTDVKRQYTLERRAWCKEAADALRPCFVGEEGEAKAIRGVMQEKLQLYHVNGDSWAVIEFIPAHSMLFIWAYAGRGSKGFVERCIISARKSGLKRVSFYSFHKGAGRLWKKFGPKAYPTGNMPGEMQYIFEVRV
jgi:hypothetical protein